MQRGAEHVLIQAKQLERTQIVKCALCCHISFLTVNGDWLNKRAERGRVSLFGYHLIIQEFTRGFVIVTFMYLTCGVW